MKMPKVKPIARLKEYYFKNDTYERVSSDLPIRILVGHKGIGKSALFKISIAEEKERGNLPILIKPDDIAELGKSDENFLLKIRQWKVGLIKIIGAKVFNELGISDENILSKLTHFGLRLVSYITESATILVMLVKRVLTYIGDKTNERILLNTKQYHLATYLDFIMEKRFKGTGKWEDIAMYKVLMSCYC